MDKPDADSPALKTQSSVGWGSDHVGGASQGWGGQQTTAAPILTVAEFFRKYPSAEPPSKSSHSTDASTIIGGRGTVDTRGLKDNIPSIMHSKERRKAARETTSKRELPPLPTLPDGLSWPADDFDKSPECGKWGGLERYLRQVWESLIPHIDMPTLRAHWPRLGEAIDRQRSKLSPELLPPLKPEITDRKAAAIPNRGERPWRLEQTLKMRAYRARKKLREVHM